MTATTSTFDLPDRLAAKRDPALIATDERHFAAVAECLERQETAISDRLAAARKAPGGAGQQALDRDQEVHRLAANLRVLGRFGMDVCLGRMVPEGGGPVYIGRLGLTDSDGRQLLIDWRAPAAEPFFAATRANPMGLESRRRYRWTGGRITDFWDEVLTDGACGVAPDDESAFIASLGASRTPRMRDVLATLQADQDAIVRAGSRGALVVHGGPGTGKTVVALHRAAYLLYTDPLLDESRGGVLFVGPHHEFLAYVADVLPSLGEDGVKTCTLRDMVPDGHAAPPESDPEVARLKSSVDMVRAVEPAVALSEQPPAQGMAVETDWCALRVDPDDWAEAFTAPDPGTPHNEARDEIWAAILAILVDKGREQGVPPEALHRSLEENADLSRALNRAWPLIEPTDLIADLWSVPAYLRRCAPWLTPDEVRALQRPDPHAWTSSDLPLLDAARARLGDPAASRRRRRRESAARAERGYMDEVVQDLLDADDDGEGLVTMLRGEDLRDALVDPNALPGADRDPLAGPFAHVVVDEAQELTDAQWQMLLRRCPSRSFTVVGDRAQARRGFAESWQERLERVGFGEVAEARLDINYRTPREVMAEARPVIEAVLPDADVPTSVRSSGLPVIRGSVGELTAILDEWLAEHGEGLACVIGYPEFEGTPRVLSLNPEHAKGLEFDLVVLVDPEAFGSGVAGGVDRYVAMTRATQQLVLLTSR